MIFRFKSIISKFVFISIIMLGSIICYIAAGYAFTRNISSEAKRINYAKQIKPNSYELAWWIHKITVTHDPKLRKSLLSEFQKNMVMFEKIINGLKYGDEQSGIKPVKYNEGLEILNQFSDDWEKNLKPMLVRVPKLSEEKARALLFEYDFKVGSHMREIDELEQLLAADYEKKVRNFDAIRLYALILFMALIVFSTLFLKYVIITPLLKLNEATKQIKNGSFNVRVNVKRDDELGELAQSFNQMAESIKIKEESLTGVNRIFRMLSEYNQVLVHCTNEASLLDEMCRIIVKEGGYCLAWIGFAEHDERKSVRMAAQAGFEDGYLKKIKITWADTESGRGPTGTAIRTGKPVIAQNILTDPNFAPWREEAKKRGYASSIALPLLCNGHVLGSLNIYAKEPDAFNSEEVKLLAELAYDLSYGIEALSIRDEQKRAEEALLESEKRFHLLVEDIKDYAIIMISPDGMIVSWNAGAERIKGYRAGEIIGKHFSCFYTKEDIEKDIPEHNLKIAREQGRFEDENLRVRKDGSKFWANIIITTIHDKSGNLNGFVKITRDITERNLAEKELQESGSKYRFLFTNMLNAYAFHKIVTDENNKPVDYVSLEVNNAFEKATGLKREDIIGKKVTEVIPGIKDSKPDLISIYGKVALTGEGTKFEFYSEPFKTWYSISVYCPSKGYFVTVFDDITHRKHIEESLLTAKNELETKVVERTAELRQANEKVLIWANETRLYTQEIILLNQMSEFLQTCISFEDAYSIITKFIQQIFPDDISALYIFKESRNVLEAVSVWGELKQEEMFLSIDDCWALRRAQTHSVTGTDEELLCPHVKEKKSLYMCIPLVARDETFGMFHLRINKTNIGNDEQKLKSKENVAMRVASQIGLILSNMKLRDSLRSMSIRDSLTGLYNRRYMEESLERELHRAERKGTSMAVMMFDLDYFKKFNDTYGHEVGDMMLRKLGAFVLQYIRRSDVACRYGGEEFVMILPDSSLDVIRERIENFRQSVKQIKIQYKGQMIGPITVSIGIAFFPKDGSTVKDILKSADMSLYRAKKTGRDKICVSDEN